MVIDMLGGPSVVLYRVVSSQNTVKKVEMAELRPYLY